jgi:hypothetical protein
MPVQQSIGHEGHKGHKGNKPVSVFYQCPFVPFVASVPFVSNA